MGEGHLSVLKSSSLTQHPAALGLNAWKGSREYSNESETRSKETRHAFTGCVGLSKSLTLFGLPFPPSK